MRTVIFPGSFSPPTLGHLNIIEKASTLFDLVYVAIGRNGQKPSSPFSFQERLNMLEKMTTHLSNINIISFDGMLITLAKQLSVSTIVRSLRGVSDFEYECMQAHMNKELGKIETLFLLPDQQYRHISSSFVRELCQQGFPISRFVPQEIEKMILNAWHA